MSTSRQRERQPWSGRPPNDEIAEYGRECVACPECGARPGFRCVEQAEGWRTLCSARFAARREHGGGGIVTARHMIEPFAASDEVTSPRDVLDAHVGLFRHAQGRAPWLAGQFAAEFSAGMSAEDARSPLDRPGAREWIEENVPEEDRAEFADAMLDRMHREEHPDPEHDFCAIMRGGRRGQG